MQIVGVIDLKDGRAVHARGGDRRQYQAVGRVGDVDVNGDALALASFYRDACGVTALYVADLDAIGGLASHDEVIAKLAITLPTWLDAGITSVAAASRALASGARRVIVGLETLPDYEALAEICVAVPVEQVILSVDLRAGRLLCRAGSPIEGDSLEGVVQRAVGLGIGTAIVLDLHRVGGHGGPPLRETERVCAACPELAVYAAGGIGSVDDLRALHALGVAGVLIASALHDGRLTRASVHSILTR